MNQLTSYTNTNDPLNQRILNNLEAGRPGGLKVDLYLGDQPTLDLTTNNLTLLSSQQYPYTALGTIGIRKLLDPPESSLVSQIVNRHAVLPSNSSADQLVLLDMQGQTEISQALRRDARHTQGSAHSHPLFDSTNQHVQWIRTHRAQMLLAFEDIRLQGIVRRQAKEAWDHYDAVSRLDATTREAVNTWLRGEDHSLGWDRFKRNDVKSGNRLSTHYTNLRGDLKTPQSITSARGEYAASKLLITVYGTDYQMKMGKSANGMRPNGIDQIWVKRDMRTGNVIEYLIVEAKGSVNATLGHPSTGQQMSPKWLFWCLINMANKNASYIGPETKTDLPVKILNALINPGGIPVRGIVFHSLHGSANESKVVQMNDIGLYQFASAFENASKGGGLFTNAPTQQYIAFK